ncbi:hypothetical protein CS022_06840 [Veronia nyctiphanis]|uniref:Uncharacterized protein n=1 Tax=Veronia nyctiphanis TaxID=1278244 RepID=A0A4Q0YTE1_9GAMM|nr:hypothetical protein CS022_06840 [Veronia nyctiphanis]
MFKRFLPAFIPHRIVASIDVNGVFTKNRQATVLVIGSTLTTFQVERLPTPLQKLGVRLMIHGGHMPVVGAATS